MQSCDSKCGQCARNFWKWLKSREHQMSMPLDSGTSFAQEAARSNVPGRALTPGTRVLYKNWEAVVLADSGNMGLDGRHWVSIFVESPGMESACRTWRSPGRVFSGYSTFHQCANKSRWFT